MRHACAFLIIAGIILTENSHAYIDPASGSMLLQIVAAAVVGALLTIKGWWTSIKSLFVRSSDAEPGNEKSEDPPGQ